MMRSLLLLVLGLATIASHDDADGKTQLASLHQITHFLKADANWDGGTQAIAVAIPDDGWNLDRRNGFTTPFHEAAESVAARGVKSTVVLLSKEEARELKCRYNRAPRSAIPSAALACPSLPAGYTHKSRALRTHNGVHRRKLPCIFLSKDKRGERRVDFDGGGGDQQWRVGYPNKTALKGWLQRNTKKAKKRRRTATSASADSHDEL